RLLQVHRRSDRSATIDIHARLVQSRPRVGGEAGDHYSQPDCVEGWTGGFAAIPNDPGAFEQSLSLDWWGRRRHGAGLLFNWHSHVYIQRGERCAETFDPFA